MQVLLPGAAQSCLSAQPRPVPAAEGEQGRAVEQQVELSLGPPAVAECPAQAECHPGIKRCKGAKHTEWDNTMGLHLQGKGCHAVTLGDLCSFQQHSWLSLFN